MAEIGDQTEWVEKGLERLRYEYDLKPDDLVIDIGSYIGEWSNGIFLKYGCKPVEFDPLVNYAAWIYDGRLKFTGAFYYTEPDINGHAEYNCIDINRELRGKQIALLKMNIEGGEYTLLPYMIKGGIIEQIENLQVQFHLGGDYEAVEKELTKTHTLTWRYPFVWENWKRK